MKTIKSIAEVILTIVAGVAFVLMFGGNPDGTLNLIWSFGWLAVLVGCGYILDKMGVIRKHHVEI